MKAVSFDFGQTLAELDYEFLQRRLGERGTQLNAEAARAASAEAATRYGQLKAEGHALAWHMMMELLLERGGLPRVRTQELASWLWSEQPRQNLWRKPLPGMIELVRELARAGVPLAVISNSEGHLAELVAELDWTRDFPVIVDSGKLGIDKPDPRIFEHAAGLLGVSTGQLLHIGDSWEADVQGALSVSASAVWFDARHRESPLPSRVYGAANAVELLEVLARLGLLS